MIFEGRNQKTNIEGLSLLIDNKKIEQVGSACKQKYIKFVGHVLDDQLTWVGHLEHICKKLASANFALNSSKNFLPLQIRRTLYYSLCRSKVLKESGNSTEKMYKKCCT